MPKRRGYRRSDSNDLYEALRIIEDEIVRLERGERPQYPKEILTRSKPKRKLSAWNKYVKANSKKPRFRYRNGKLNLKKMAVAFRKTPAGKKKRR